jgi:acyl-coenzyme A synthetase/AMP-(fatty) acid ligase
VRLDANRVAREYLQYHPLLGSSLTQLPEMDAVVAWRTGGAVTRLQFLHDVLWVAKSLPDHANVINVCDDRYLFMVGFAAAILRGQVSLLPPSRVPGAVMAIAAEYANSYLLVDRPVGDGALPQFRFGLAPGATAAAPAAVGLQPAVPLIDLDQLVVILFTSGTTGQATPNPKAWRTVVRGAAANAATLRPESDQPYTLVATVPSQHMYGFETTVMLPLQGYCAVQCDRPFYPEDVRRTLARTPEPRLLVTTPVHLRSFAEFSGTMPPVNGILSATAPLTQKLAAACEMKFSAPLKEIFGCTETGIIATRRTACDETWRLLDHFEIEAGDSGTVVRGKHLLETVYLQDLIAQLDDRHFRLIGRAADLTIVAGKRTSLGDLNSKLLSIDGVRDGIIFMPTAGLEGVNEGKVVRLAAFVVAPGMTREQVMSALRQVIDPAFLPRPLLLVDALPRTESSKLPRAAVLELYAERMAK